MAEGGFLTPEEIEAAGELKAFISNHLTGYPIKVVGGAFVALVAELCVIVAQNDKLVAVENAEHFCKDVKDSINEASRRALN